MDSATYIRIASLKRQAERTIDVATAKIRDFPGDANYWQGQRDVAREVVTQLTIIIACGRPKPPAMRPEEV